MEGGKSNGGKGQNCNRINDGNGSLALEKVEMRSIWKEYFENLYNIDTQPRNRLQSTCVGLMVYREATTFEELR